MREGNLPSGWEGLTGTRPQLDVTPQMNRYWPGTFNCTFNFPEVSVTSALSLSGAFALAIWDKSGFLMPCMRLMWFSSMNG